MKANERKERRKKRWRDVSRKVWGERKETREGGRNGWMGKMCGYGERTEWKTGGRERQMDKGELSGSREGGGDEQRETEIGGKREGEINRARWIKERTDK